MSPTTARMRSRQSDAVTRILDGKYESRKASGPGLPARSRTRWTTARAVISGVLGQLHRGGRVRAETDRKSAEVASCRGIGNSGCRRRRSGNMHAAPARHGDLLRNSLGNNKRISGQAVQRETQGNRPGGPQRLAAMRRMRGASTTCTGTCTSGAVTGITSAPGGIDPDLSGVREPLMGWHLLARRRGGGFGDDGIACRSARRHRYEPERRPTTSVFVWLPCGYSRSPISVYCGCGRQRKRTRLLPVVHWPPTFARLPSVTQGLIYFQVISARIVKADRPLKEGEPARLGEGGLAIASALRRNAPGPDRVLSKINNAF